MLSLGNAFSDEEVADFDRRVRDRLASGPVEYAAEPKLDGLAVSLRYEAGRLVRAVQITMTAKGEDDSYGVVGGVRERTLVNRVNIRNLALSRGPYD